MKTRAELKLNNRGSGIVSVLIAIVFLSTLGSMLMMLTYTGVEMRASDRKGKENLYDASAVLEEIRASVQEVCSEAVASTYEYALVYYNDPDTEAVTEIFRTRYRDIIENYKTASGLQLFSKEDSGKYTYNLDALTALVPENHDSGASFEIVSVSNREVTGFTADLSGSETPPPIVLKGISVKYTKGDRTTRVTSDISIDYPFFDYKKEGFTTADIVNYACIVRGNLIHHGGTDSSYINGNSYFGNVELTGDGALVLKEGTFVTPGAVSVNGQGITKSGSSYSRLQVGDLHKEGSTELKDWDKEAKIWAKDIDIGALSSVALLGEANIANDLVFSGTGAKATLVGNYYGFGSSSINNTKEDDEGNPYSSAAESSSIIVNKKNATLDLSGVKNLSLAGFSFIGGSSTSAGSDVQMGESVSVKKNQRAYSIPAKYIYVENNEGEQVRFHSNPQIMEPDDYAAIDQSTWNFTDEPILGSKKMSDYNAVPVPRIDYYAGQSIVYVYAKFNSDEDAVKYFRDYYRYNKNYIDSGFDDFVTITAASDDANIIMPGDTAAAMSEGSVETGAFYLANEARLKADTYNDLLRTLSQAPKNENDEFLDPIAYLINEPNVQSLGNGEKIEYKSGNKVTALIVNGDITVSSDNYPDVNFLIQVGSGKVTMNRDFNGLIIAYGDLEIKDGVTINKDPDQLVVAYEATNTDGGNIIFYTEHINIAGDGSTWSVYDLVGYSGWSRDTDDDDYD